MPENPSTVVPTDPTTVVSSPGTTPAAPVNTAPTTHPAPADFTSEILKQEQRIRDLMSRADRATSERDNAIANQIEMQRQLTDYQAQAQQHLQMAADTAQTALDRQKQLEKDMETLRAQNLRANLILTKPHLGPYMDFLPLTTDEATLRQSVERLEQIRNNDLAVSRGGFTTPLSPMTPTVPGIPSPSGPALGNVNAFSPTGIPSIPGANPAQMNTMGTATDTIETIKKLYAQAKASGKQEDWQAAHKQAQELATADARRQQGQG